MPRRICKICEPSARGLATVHQGTIPGKGKLGGIPNPANHPARPGIVKRRKARKTKDQGLRRSLSRPQYRTDKCRAGLAGLAAKKERTKKEDDEALNANIAGKFAKEEE